MTIDLAEMKQDLYKLFNRASAYIKNNGIGGSVTPRDVAALAEAIVSIEKLEREIAQENGITPFIGKRS